MKISEADVLFSDLVAAAASQGEQYVRDVLARMIRETRPGQVWGVSVPTRLLDGVTLPPGLQAVKGSEVMAGGSDAIAAITGTVQQQKGV